MYLDLDRNVRSMAPTFEDIVNDADLPSQYPVFAPDCTRKHRRAGSVAVHRRSPYPCRIEATQLPDRKSTRYPTRADNPRQRSSLTVYTRSSVSPDAVSHQGDPPIMYLPVYWFLYIPDTDLGCTVPSTDAEIQPSVRKPVYFHRARNMRNAHEAGTSENGFAGDSPRGNSDALLYLAVQFFFFRASLCRHFMRFLKFRVRVHSIFLFRPLRV